MHTFMVFLWDVLMAFSVKSFPEYSHILQTTQRSMPLSDLRNSAHSKGYRVLVATIHDMGRCPCPWCTVKKEDLHTLGTTSNTNSRVTKLQHDNDNFRAIVEQAHNNIYQNSFALHSKPGVEQFLKEESLLPTLVSSPVFCPVYYIQYIPPVEFLFALSQGFQVWCLPLCYISPLDCSGLPTYRLWLRPGLHH